VRKLDFLTLIVCAAILALIILALTCKAGQNFQYHDGGGGSGNCETVVNAGDSIKLSDAEHLLIEMEPERDFYGNFLRCVPARMSGNAKIIRTVCQYYLAITAALERPLYEECFPIAVFIDEINKHYPPKTNDIPSVVFSWEIELNRDYEVYDIRGRLMRHSWQRLGSGYYFVKEEKSDTKPFKVLHLK
jgi:hypothetical protein